MLKLKNTTLFPASFCNSKTLVCPRFTFNTNWLPRPNKVSVYNSTALFSVWKRIFFRAKQQNLKAFAAPAVLTRYGINNYCELRLITEYSIIKENIYTLSGINSILIGFKINLLEKKGLIPTTFVDCSYWFFKKWLRQNT